MKQHLYTKLLILYLVLGGICFLLLSSGGSYLVEKRLERSTGESPVSYTHLTLPTIQRV